METLKQTIKTLAAAQSSLKNQRKTVKIIGERTMTARQAFFQHQANRERLRHMYIAYAELRGRDVADSLEEYSVSLVEKFKEEYKDKVK